jgi:predicted HicB family RNase H-like nuclease
MRHGDYVARVEYDPETAKFFGRVVNTADVITFYGASVEDLQRELATSIEAHEAFCREQGIAPSKPYSGKFNVRMAPDQHAKVSAAAAAAGQSMNSWVVDTLSRAAERTLGD